MKTLMMDIETYSGADLAKCGAYRYAKDPDFEVLLLATSADASWGCSPTSRSTPVASPARSSARTAAELHAQPSPQGAQPAGVLSCGSKKQRGSACPVRGTAPHAVLERKSAAVLGLNEFDADELLARRAHRGARAARPRLPPEGRHRCRAQVEFHSQARHVDARA